MNKRACNKWRITNVRCTDNSELLADETDTEIQEFVDKIVSVGQNYGM